MNVNLDNRILLLLQLSTNCAGSATQDTTCYLYLKQQNDLIDILSTISGFQIQYLPPLIYDMVSLSSIVLK